MHSSCRRPGWVSTWRYCLGLSTLPFSRHYATCYFQYCPNTASESVVPQSKYGLRCCSTSVSPNTASDAVVPQSKYGLRCCSTSVSQNTASDAVVPQLVQILPQMLSYLSPNTASDAVVPQLVQILPQMLSYLSPYTASDAVVPQLLCSNFYTDRRFVGNQRKSATWRNCLHPLSKLNLPPLLQKICVCLCVCVCIHPCQAKHLHWT